MPWKPPRPCPVTSPDPCPRFIPPTPGAYMCAEHTRERRRQSDRKRGTFTQRGYGPQHGDRFRAGVLRDAYTCACAGCSRHRGQCLAQPDTADHWPRTRRQLVELGLDADDPAYGRALCKMCHDVHTAAESPGGWRVVR